MQITVFGANGRVGRLVVEEALKRNFTVRAFIHGNNPLTKNDNLQIIKGNIYNKNDVIMALDGSDSVISALGSWGTPNKDILSEGMKNIIPAMHNLNMNKIISLTGTGCKSSHDTPSILHSLNRLPLLVVAPKVLRDAEKHIKLLEESRLEWTILRSPVMNDAGNPRSFKITKKIPPPWAKINRKAVAIAMLDLLENSAETKKAPFIARS